LAQKVKGVIFLVIKREQLKKPVKIKINPIKNLQIENRKMIKKMRKAARRSID